VGQNQSSTPGPAWSPKGRGRGIAVNASPLVLGLVALGVSLFLSYIIGGLLGLASIAWGRMAYGMAKQLGRNAGPGAKAMAVVGIVLGAVTVVLYVIGFVTS
jgi:hypothetical protein